MTEKMAAAICEQIGRELAAHLEYLSIAAHFDADGLPELTRFFSDQAQEEHDHAMKFLAYVMEAGGPVTLPGVDGPRQTFASAEEAVELSLEWEKAVTGHINDLVDLALEQKDHATRAMLDWFVTEQVEEVAVMGELLQVVRRAGEGGLLLVEDYVARSAAGAGAGAGEGAAPA